MRALFPGFQYFRNMEGRGWIGTLQPTLKSREYTIKVLQPGHARPGPRVYVLDPVITDWIHRLKDGALCLYYPPDRDWNEEKIMAYTIIPWAAEWLYWYEIWQETGEWYGPEAPHDGQKI